MVDTAAEWSLVILAIFIGIILALGALPVLVYKVFVCLIKGRFYDQTS